MTSNLSIALWKIPKPNELGDEVGEKRVVEAIQDPRPERMHLEKDALLTELVKLRVAVKEAS